MSHELRTPLNAIMGFSQLLERDPSLTKQQRSSMDIINRSGEHLLSLINDVLDISKIEAGRMILHEEGFDLHQMIFTLASMFEDRAQAKHLDLQVEQDLNLPHYVIADEGKLRQVLINLLANAIKFTHQGHVHLRI